MRFARLASLSVLAGTLITCCAAAHAGERVTLRNGFSVSCDHRQPIDAEHIRLFLTASSANYVDIATSSIASVEAEASPATAAVSTTAFAAETFTPSPVSAPLAALVQRAGEAHRINVDLLRAVIHAESGGRANAVSRAGAQGLMQLMPATAHSLGVQNSFAPEENVRGGTDYLDTLLRRYHDDLPLALAAYNAGPAAVDRSHGVPPYRETRLYVARIIREFNRRTLLAQREAHAPGVTASIGASTTR